MAHQDPPTPTHTANHTYLQPPTDTHSLRITHPPTPIHAQRHSLTSIHTDLYPPTYTDPSMRSHICMTPPPPVHSYTQLPPAFTHTPTHTPAHPLKTAPTPTHNNPLPPAATPIHPHPTPPLQSHFYTHALRSRPKLPQTATTHTHIYQQTDSLSPTHRDPAPDPYPNTDADD